MCAFMFVANNYTLLVCHYTGDVILRTYRHTDTCMIMIVQQTRQSDAEH